MNTSYDVITVGGGPAGCAAAISAARRGSKVLLVEQYGFLGGMGTVALVSKNDQKYINTAGRILAQR